MELTSRLGYRQVLGIVRQLPDYQIEKIKNELMKNFMRTKTKLEVSDFQRFILSGPVMSDNQYENFQQQREHFSLWRAI